MRSYNFAHFHRRRIMIATTFMGCYGYLCNKARSPSVNEILRLGFAGSIANVTIESMFHFADTVNVRAKTTVGNDSTMNILKNIYRKEGLFGFSKGFSAMFYGSIFCGFIYFSLYKWFKGYYREKLNSETNPATIYFAASLTAEFFTLVIYYPFDLIKCRL